MCVDLTYFVFTFQRLFVEMEQMASRPFAQVYLELGRSVGPAGVTSLRKRKKVSVCNFILIYFTAAADC